MPDENNEASEVVDEDVVPEEFPPEQPYGVNEDQFEDSVAERAARERPDRLGADVGRVGTLVDQGDESGDDLEPDAVADEMPPGSTPLIAAEDAAMHLTDPPPMGDGDGYIDD